MFSGLVVCFGRIVFTYPWRLSRSFHNFLTNFKQPFFSLLFSFYCSEFLQNSITEEILKSINLQSVKLFKINNTINICLFCRWRHHMKTNYLVQIDKFYLLTVA